MRLLSVFLYLFFSYISFYSVSEENKGSVSYEREDWIVGFDSRYNQSKFITNLRIKDISTDAFFTYLNKNHKEFDSFEVTPCGMKDGSTLSLRDKPNINGKELLRLPQGLYQLSVSHNNRSKHTRDWVYVNYYYEDFTAEGWVHKKYLCKTEQLESRNDLIDKYNMSLTSINNLYHDEVYNKSGFVSAFICHIKEDDFVAIRNRPSLEGKVIVKAPVGSRYIIGKNDMNKHTNNWVYINKHGYSGWVYKKYLCLEKKDSNFNPITLHSNYLYVLHSGGNDFIAAYTCNDDSSSIYETISNVKKVKNTLPPNSRVNINKQDVKKHTDNWTFIRYENNKGGWISSTNICLMAPPG